MLLALCSACSSVPAPQDHNARPSALALPFTGIQVRMVYPDGTDNVGRAVSYMLEPHAYRPAHRDASGGLIAQRRFIDNFGTEPVPLPVALERLVGQDAQVMLDRERKLYAFRLKHPDEPGVAFADLGSVSLAADAVPASLELGDQPAPAPTETVAPGAETTLHEADPGSVSLAADAIPASLELSDQPAPVPTETVAPGAETALHEADRSHAEAENAMPPGAHRHNCRSIQFRNRAMLSVTVRNYFLECGFEEVFWKLGEPGMYADYRLSQDLDVPLPEHHLDLIELLQARFGISTLINEDNSVEFHDDLH